MRNIFDINVNIQTNGDPFGHYDYRQYEPTLRNIIEYYYLDNNFSQEEAEKLTNKYIDLLKLHMNNFV